MKLDTVRIYKAPEFVGDKCYIVNQRDLEKWVADGWTATPIAAPVPVAPATEPTPEGK